MSYNTYHVTDAPPLPALPTGYPLLVFRLGAMPSYNDILYLTRKQTVSFIRQERLRGRSEAAVWLQRERIPVKLIQERGRGGVSYLRSPTSVFPQRLFCYAEIKRRASVKTPEQGDRVRDVYNLAAKAFVDGCTDAGLWDDDSELYHSDLWIHYAGTSPVDSVEIRFYESPY